MAYSADFLKKYASLAASKTNAAAAAGDSGEASLATGSETVEDIRSDIDPTEPRSASMVGTRPSEYANARSNTVQGVVYDPTSGKAFPNAKVAVAEGVANYTSKVPSGMNIDWSYWDKFKQPDPVKPAPAPATETAPAPVDVTVPFEAPTPAPTPVPAPRPADRNDLGEPKMIPEPPAPPPPAPAPRRKSPPPPPPPPPAPKIATKAEWNAQATYFSGSMAGKKVAGDKNSDKYYANYVKSMQDSINSGQTEKANATNAMHGLNPGAPAPKPAPKPAPVPYWQLK